MALCRAVYELDEITIGEDSRDSRDVVAVALFGLGVMHVNKLQVAFAGQKTRACAAEACFRFFADDNFC